MRVQFSHYLVYKKREKRSSKKKQFPVFLYKAMKVKIKRIDKNLPIPLYQTSGAVCFDLFARETTEVPPNGIALIPTNIIVKVPEGFMFMLASRSSTLMKKGLICGNSIGIIDQDYHGPEDEIKYQAYNTTNQTVIVEKGERICQGCFIPIQKVEFEEVEEISDISRGGFGSTGHK